MNHRSAPDRPLALTLLALMLGLAVGCQGPARPVRMSDQIDDVQVTEWQLRLLTMDYARSFAASVERASDQIAAVTEDPQIRRSALRWKTNAIAASQSALLKDDPVVVVIDQWALTEQMARFLDSGAGRELFGTEQPTAIEAALGLEQEITQLAGSVSAQEGAPKMRGTVEAWVSEHPIDLSFTRRQPRSVIESLQGGSRLGALAAVESLEESVAIHTQLLPVFLEVLPKQAAWRAELVIEDYFSRQEMEQAAEDLHAISASILLLHEEIDILPALLDEQRDAVFVELHKEVEQVTLFIDQQRIATLEGIDSQRVETIDAITEERQIVLDAVDEQRMATLAELPKLAIASLEQADPEIRSLVDYVFWRAALLCSVMGSLGLLAGVFLARQLKGGRPAPRGAE